VAGVGAWLYFRPATPSIEEGTVLTVDLTHALPEASSPGPLSRLVSGEPVSLRDVLDAIERAGNDPRVTALFARVGDGGHRLAEVQELREAIAAFRAKGKKAIAFADSFGEFGSGLRGYYLATAFNQIWVQPLGSLELIGLRSETPFFRGTLDKIGIEPRLDHREQYKTAMNTLTETGMTPPHREMMESILHSAQGQLVRDIAQARGIPPAEAERLVESGPYTPAEAKRLHLIDEVGYRDEALAAAGGRATNQPIKPADYLDAAGRPHSEGPRIALIYGTGIITRGDSESNPLTGAVTLGADTMMRAFRSAVADPKVRAILFRIDSPGGSAVASETIWREVSRARQAGKPVIVSMGDVAGSGGYYIAAAADKIVAQPATLTGSIGVLGGKLLLNGLWAKLGVSWDAVQIGDDAAMFSDITDFSPAERRKFEAELDAVYAGFKARVAAGRHLDADQVEAVAKGRVWTGEQAKARGLVDGLGGFPEALRLVRIAAGLRADAPIELRRFPPEHGPGFLFLNLLLGRDEEVRGRIGSWLEPLRSILTRVEALAGRAGVLVMPDIELQ
jgi:protease-4